MAGSPKSEGTGVLVAPNFSIGAVLMMRFAAEAAQFYESVGDHRAAPPGQGRRALRHLPAYGGADRRRPRAKPASARSPTPPPPGSTEPAAPTSTGIRVHGLRVRGLVAHQEVVLGGVGETLTIRHDSLDRVSFTPGVLLGLRQIADHPGLTVGLEEFLDL